MLIEQDRIWPRPLARFAQHVERKLDEELRRTGQLTYDAMLSRLADAVTGPPSDASNSSHLADVIRHRFDAALVDEFQDTDRAQWSVMQKVFAHPDRQLLIIGDPKQAIYAFRGAPRKA